MTKAEAKAEEKAKERRRHVRVSSGYGVRYALLTEKVFKKDERGKEARKAKDKNISGGGIFIETDEELPIGALLGLEICLNKLKFPLFVVGEVMRIDGPDEKGKFGIGVKFLRISDNDTLEIFNYMVEKVVRESESERLSP